MLSGFRMMLMGIVAVTGIAGAALADDATDVARKLADDRAKVETAMSLIALGEAEQDGQMLAVAARLLAGVGPVARPGKSGAGSEPEFVNVEALIEAAGGFGGDTARAVRAASTPAAKPRYCALGYWSQTCDYNGYCTWQYVC